MSHYNVGVFSALVLPLSGLLNMDAVSVLGLSFWMYLLYGVSSLPWGVLGDRAPRRLLLGLMFVGSAFSAATAAVTLHDPWGLWCSLTCLGLFSGIYHPIGMGMISTGVTRVSLGMGYNAALGGLGLVAAPLISGVLNYYGGPRWPFMFLAALNLLGVATPFLLGGRRGVREQVSQPDTSEGMLGAFFFLLTATALAGVAFGGATVILPTYLELRGGGILDSVKSLWGAPFSGNLVATTATAFVYIAGMAGQYIGGHVGERHDQRYAYLVFHALCIVPALIMAHTCDLALVASATVYFFFLLGMQPFENTLVAKFSPNRLRQSAYGFKFVLTFGVGSLGVKLVQAVDRTGGPEAVFTVLSAISVLTALSVMGMIVCTNRATAGIARRATECSISEKR
jgi:MFS family permease